jgi:hypothetical protein
MCCFIIREGAFFSEEIENHFVVNVVADTTAYQLGIPHYVLYVRPALEKKIPFVPYAVHFLIPLPIR